MNPVVIRCLSYIQLLGIPYAFYSELAPQTWPFRLPPGMGTAIGVITATMAVVLLVLVDESRARINERSRQDLLHAIATNVSLVLPVHEREFYALWPGQVRSAMHNIDVTHLGVRPPQFRHGGEEETYFRNLEQIYQSSGAQIRRVERLTEEKLPWIKQLITQFSQMDNVSLAVYRDPFPDEMPAALSVCRVDDRFAWIVALAEHESTTGYRDLLLTGKHSVALVARYFHERLWQRSVVIVNRGTVRADWETEVRI